MLLFVPAIFAGMKIRQIKKVGNVFCWKIYNIFLQKHNGCSRSLLYHNEIYIYNQLDSKTRNFMHLYFQCPKMCVYYMPSILDACSKKLKENNIYLYVTRQILKMLNWRIIIIGVVPLYCMLWLYLWNHKSAGVYIMQSNGYV